MTEWLGLPPLATAHGGQIVVSAATQRLVPLAVPAGWVLRELGEFHLKDLAVPEWVFQVAGEGLTERFPRLQQLVQQRESLRAIFEDKTIKDAASGATRLQAWMEQAKALGLKALEKFCKTLGNWLGRIANYFVWRSSNGRTEGFNHGLRAILWRAYGMLNFRHFRLRVLDRFGQSAKP